MANEIQKMKSARKLSNSPKTQEINLEHESTNNDAILDCKKQIVLNFLFFF